MDEKFNLINTRDLPEHIDEDMRRYMSNILGALVPATIPVAFGALQGALSYYLLGIDSDMKDKVIDGMAEGLKRSWRQNEGKGF